MGRYFTYIITNKRRGILYTGMTNSLSVRTLQHKHKFSTNSFTSRYKLKRLVWFESFSSPGEAIQREKEIKGWKRDKKINLIEQSNPEWKDLFGKMYMSSRKRYRKMSDDWGANDTD